MESYASQKNLVKSILHLLKFQLEPTSGMLYILQAQSSALKEIPVVVMSSENDSNRIERFVTSLCAHKGVTECLLY